MERSKIYRNDYSVSNNGIIKSLKFGKEKILKNRISNGYCKIKLTFDNKPFHTTVHRLVAECFIPNPHSKETVNHKDGNKQNNNDWNLEWCTRKENDRHSRDILGNNFTKENHGMSKLTQTKVNEIRKKYSTGNYRYKDLCKEYNVGMSNMSRIIKYKLWT
jgi:hypothetical protein